MQEHKLQPLVDALDYITKHPEDWGQGQSLGKGPVCLMGHVKRKLKTSSDREVIYELGITQDEYSKIYSGPQLLPVLSSYVDELKCRYNYKHPETGYKLGDTVIFDNRKYLVNGLVTRKKGKFLELAYPGSSYTNTVSVDQVTKFTKVTYKDVLEHFNRATTVEDLVELIKCAVKDGIDF